MVNVLATEAVVLAPARLLGNDGRLRFRDTDCLGVRFPDGECGLCEMACPSGALRFDAGRPIDATHCIGCGQCSAVCPTSALATEGFAYAREAVRDAPEIYVDCWRVVAEESPSEALRVPCLAGLSVGRLLALFDMSGERSVILLDRGQCHACPAGCGMDRFRERLSAARILLYEAGVAPERLPVMNYEPVRQPMRPAIPASAGEVRTGRRGFFRDLIGGIARGADDFAGMRDGGGHAIVLRERLVPLDKMRAVTALRHVAARHGRSIPAKALPRISLGECSAHGVCVSVCPTGALERRQRAGADGAELWFHAARCITCGQCATACPDKALRVHDEGGHAEVDRVARWSSRECEVCNEEFVGGGAAVCPACHKQQSVVAGMATLFRRPSV